MLSLGGFRIERQRELALPIEIEARAGQFIVAVPGAHGCGGALSPIVDLAVDLDVGIPAVAGKSSAIMKSTLYETKAEYAEKYIPKEKKPKK